MPEANEHALAYLGLGADLGDRQRNLCHAISRLQDHAEIEFDPARDIASLYETSPIDGPPDQGYFLNTALRIRTWLDPVSLLETCLAVERALGRVRRERNSPRTVDIDVLLYDGLVRSDERLTLPHPRLHRRLFVLEPLAELDPGLVHPVSRCTIADLLRRCREAGDSGTVVRLCGPEWLAAALSHGLPASSGPGGCDQW